MTEETSARTIFLGALVIICATLIIITGMAASCSVRRAEFCVNGTNIYCQ